MTETSAKTNENVNETFSQIFDAVKNAQTLAGPVSVLNSSCLKKLKVQHKAGWVKMKKAGKTAKKRYVIITDSGLRYYAEQPVHFVVNVMTLF